jgi:hypothetical protein
MKCGHSSPLRCTRECYNAEDHTPDKPADRRWARALMRRLKAEKSSANRAWIKNLREYIKTGIYPYVPL